MADATRPAPDEVSENRHPALTEFLIGHDPAERTLLAASQSAKLHHAWMITGPAGIGKATLAYRFAKFLLRDEASGGGLFGDGPSDLSVPVDDLDASQVAAQSQEVAALLADADEIPVTVEWRPVLTSQDAIRRAALEANADDSVVGVIAWMHTFSPAKMWIAGLEALAGVGQAQAHALGVEGLGAGPGQGALVGDAEDDAGPVGELGGRHGSVGAVPLGPGPMGSGADGPSPTGHSTEFRWRLPCGQGVCEAADSPGDVLGGLRDGGEAGSGSGA